MKKRLRKKMYRHLAALSAAEKKDYPDGGRCLCYFCGQRFPVSCMREDDWLEEWDGRITALCPFCTQDTVLPDPEHIPQSWVRAAHRYGFGSSPLPDGVPDPQTGKIRYPFATIIVQ